MYPNGEWIDRIIDHLTKKIPYNKMFHYENTYRPKITKELRRLVWDSELTTKNCYSCKDSIHFDSFECGHIIPLCMGGSTNKNNLKAICHDCNQDMGTIHMDMYIKIKNESL